MNEQVKKMWLDALRSGRYKQGQNVLHAYNSVGDERFCCLGVLCDIAVKHNVVARSEEAKPNYPEIDGHNTAGFSYGWQSAMVDLPVEVIKWAGLPICDDDNDIDYFNHGDPLVVVNWDDDEEAEKNISTLNDSGWSFADIADIIEEQL